MRDHITENNAERPATRKQLWAIFCLSKKDYRGQDLTRLDASKLIQQLQAEKASKPTKPKTTTLEQEFLDYMTDKMQYVINTAKQALQIKSVVETDDNLKDKNNNESYAFFGFGCGCSIIEFDKRSKVGKQIKELADKHHYTTFETIFLKAFTPKEINYFKKIGCPLTAIYAQDIEINRSYTSAVVTFMERKGVKNVRIKTFYD